MVRPRNPISFRYRNVAILLLCVVALAGAILTVVDYRHVSHQRGIASSLRAAMTELVSLKKSYGRIPQGIDCDGDGREDLGWRAEFTWYARPTESGISMRQSWDAQTNLDCDRAPPSIRGIGGDGLLTSAICVEGESPPTTVLVTFPSTSHWLMPTPFCADVADNEALASFGKDRNAIHQVYVTFPDGEVRLLDSRVTVRDIKSCADSPAMREKLLKNSTSSIY